MSLLEVMDEACHVVVERLLPTLPVTEKVRNFNCSLTLYLLVSSADNFCKQFAPRSGPTKCPP